MRFLLVVLVLVLGATPALNGQEIRNLRINGFGGWSYGRTNQNLFLGAEPNGEFTKSQFALKATGTAIPSVQINAQVFFRTGRDGSEARLDYGFVDWELSPALHLRLGKAKHPFGIYSEVAGLGTVRPFLNLPQSVYGPIALVSRAYNGIGLQGDLALGDGWSLVYDAYAGGIDFEQEESGLGFFTNPEVEDFLDVNIFKSEDVVGGRLQIATPVDGLRVGASFYSGRPDQPEEDTPLRYLTWGVQGEYVVDRTWIRAEYVRQRDRLPGFDDLGTAYYVEAARFLTDEIQVAVSTNRLDVELPEELFSFSFPVDLLMHREHAVGLNYWISPEFGIKSSVHFTEGNFLAELGSEADYLAAFLFGTSPRPKTRLFQFGAQFSF